MSGVAPNNEDGFTLVELLVALTLLGMLTVLLFEGMSLAARAWSTVERRTRAASDLWTAQRVIRRVIVGAYPAFASANRLDRTISFDGEAQKLALVGPLPRAIVAGVNAQMEFFVVPEGRSRALVMDWRLDLPVEQDETVLPEHQAKLLGRIRRVSFSYFGPPQRGQTPVWQHRWSGRTRLPDLVRLHIDRDDPNSPAWPDLVMPTRATVNTDCMYHLSLGHHDAHDVLATECRRIR